MSIDWLIIGSSISMFAVFFCIHVFVLRSIKVKKAVMSIVKLYIYLGIFSLLVRVLGMLAPGGSHANFFHLFLVFYIYTLMVFVYTMGVFGMIATSIRMRLLTEIAKSPKGLTRNKLLVEYNAKTAITRRLTRMVSSGDLHYRGGYYTVPKAISPFSIPSLFLQFVWWLYGK